MADSVEELVRPARPVRSKKDRRLIFDVAGSGRGVTVTSYSHRSEPAGHSSQVLSRCSHQELVSRSTYAS
jgi:hypothetical protein